MPDLKTRLSTLMIEFSNTHSGKSLAEMTGLIQRLENPGDFRIAREFFLSNKSDNLNSSLRPE